MHPAARYAEAACQRAGLLFRLIDGGPGLLFEISGDRSGRILGAGRACSYPFNDATGYTLARDKAHTAAILAARGVAAIKTCAFFIDPAWRHMWPSGRGRDDIASAIAASDGYPVFIKPLAGSRGDFAEVIPGDDALADYLSRIAGRHDAVVVQPVVSGEEYRVVMLDGQALGMTQKNAVTLVGDGVTTASALLALLNDRLAGRGVSPYAPGILAAAGSGPDCVLPHGTRLVLPGRRNLAGHHSLAGHLSSDPHLGMGGGSDPTVAGIARVSGDVPAPLAAITSTALEAIGLRFGAVDLFDRSVGGNLSDLVVIEINCNPSLDAFEHGGGMVVIDRLWDAVVAECVR